MPLADITAYPGGIDTSGFGLGGFGSGSLGQAAGTYSWTSDPLDAGTWSFAVRPYDAAGNLGTAQVTTVMIVAPPREPATFASDGITRLKYSLVAYGQSGFGQGGFGLPAAMLTWNPSL